MKDKQLACVLLILVIAGLAYGIQKFHTELVTLQEDVSRTEDEVSTATSKRDTTSKDLTRLKQDTQGLRDYFDRWLPHLGSVGGVQRQEQKVFDTIKSAQVLASEQRTEVVETGGAEENFIPQMLRAHLVIQDDYTKTMNWFGVLEQELPSLRVANFKMTKGVSRNDVQLEITADFPLVSAGGGQG